MFKIVVFKNTSFNLNFYFYSDERGLTNSRILELSKAITKKEQLRVLALRGLGLEYHRVEAHFCNYPTDVVSAAYLMLREWRDTRFDRREAFKELCEALEKTNMRLLIGYIL